MKKKIVAFALTLLLLVISCLISAMWGLHQEHIAREKAANAIRIYDYFQEVRILFEQTLMGPHDYLIHVSKDEREIFLSDYEKLLAKIDGLKSLIAGQRMRYGPELEGMLRTAEDYLVIIEDKLPEFKMKALDFFELELPMENHRAGFYMEEMDVFVRELGAALKDEGTVLLELSSRAEERGHTVHVRILVLLIIFGIIAVFVGIILSHYIIGSITRSVDSLIEATRKIKGGDLTVRANVKTQDEIGELAGSFNEMVSELAEAQEHISAILQGSGDAMRVIDNDFNILQINRQMERLAGMSAKETVGERCYEVFHGESCHTNNCTLKRILRGEEWSELESIRETKDGRKIAVELIATPFRRGGKTAGVIESFRDITKRKMMEEALRNSELLYRTLFASAPMGIGLAAPDGHVLAYNDTMLHLTGYSRGELDQVKLKESYQDPEERAVLLERLQEDGFVRDFEVKLKRKDGTPYYASLNVTRLSLEAQDVLLTMAQDITERRYAEEELQKAHDELEQRVKDRTVELARTAEQLELELAERKQAEEALRKSERELHFLSSQLLTAQERERRRLSVELHDELGQALMVLKLRVRSIQKALGAEEARLKGNCDEVIGYINEVTENVRRLSRDLSPSILEDLGLTAAIRWLVDASTKHCNIKSSLDMTELDHLFSQEGQITVYRIVQECLTNVAKHAEATHVSIVIRKQDGQASFCVEDDGKGFDVKEVTGRDPSKKGLGLAAMCERTRMLGGSLDMWSQKGAGTRISFTVPLDERGNQW